MSKGNVIDYSKWDNFNDSDEEEQEISHRPRVTNLGSPSRISSSKDGTIHIHPSMDDRASSSKESALKAKRSSDKGKHSGSDVIISPSEAIPDSWSRNGGIVKDYDAIDNGFRTTIYWSQDRYNVQVRFLVVFKPDILPSKSIQIIWEGKIFKYVDRFAAVGTTASSTTARVQVFAKGIENNGDKALLEGTLPHPIHFHEDEDEELDWSIEYDPAGKDRYVVLNFPKASPMEGMSLKWKRPFSEVNVDVDNGAEISKGQSAFQEAWNQAHKQFREKARTGKLPSFQL
mmetsp:Transcript_16321/g.24034  ORF Transcript_16321/g.24034 Transcript_16321/m.24034 type:complete len:287 (-) Transcript_16321:320-1180(-)